MTANIAVVDFKKKIDANLIGCGLLAAMRVQEPMLNPAFRSRE
jgi:hypothetical protein